MTNKFFFASGDKDPLIEVGDRRFMVLEPPSYMRETLDRLEDQEREVRLTFQAPRRRNEGGMTPRQIANFVADGMACRSCGAVFDSINDPHTDEDCPKRHADWDIADRKQLAAALLERLNGGESQ